MFGKPVANLHASCGALAESSTFLPCRSTTWSATLGNDVTQSIATDFRGFVRSFRRRASHFADVGWTFDTSNHQAIVRDRSRHTMKHSRLERLSPMPGGLPQGMGAALGAACVDSGRTSPATSWAAAATRERPEATTISSRSTCVTSGTGARWCRAGTFTIRRGDRGDRAALFFGADELRRYTVNGTTVYLTADSPSSSPTSITSP